MDQDAIFGPVLATVLLTFLVWMYMYVRRIRFINREGLTPEQLAIPGELARVRIADERVLRVTRDPAELVGWTRDDATTTSRSGSGPARCSTPRVSPARSAKRSTSGDWKRQV